MAANSHGVGDLEEVPHSSPALNADKSTAMDEIVKLKKELEVLKDTNPFRMAELAIEIQIERLRIVEISSARDAAIQRLSEAYTSIRQKNELIEQLQNESISGKIGLASALTRLPQNRPLDYEEIEGHKAHIATLEKTVEDLRLIIGQQQQSRQNSVISKLSDPPPQYEESTRKVEEKGIQTDFEEAQTSQSTLDYKYTPPDTDDPTELVNARNAFLAEIPLPQSAPDATLSAIVVPPPFTLHEFLNGSPSALRNSLANYRILQGVNTLWCPEREEHGYMYVPAFKCSTNPKIATAHRWAPVDVIGRLSKPTECFFNKEGLWYYAGSYRAFRLDTLSTKEWLQLSPEVTTAIIKETIAGRKNISPQNTYETSQLYAAGALKVVCVGLQCIGFNQDVYNSLIEYSVKFSESKWKPLAAAAAAAAAANGSALLGSQSPTGSATGASNAVSQNNLCVPGQSPPNGMKSPALSRHASGFNSHLHRTSSHLSTASASSSLSSVSLSLNLGGTSLSAAPSAANSPSALSPSNPTTPSYLNNVHTHSQSYFTLPGTPASLCSGSASNAASGSLSVSSGSGFLGFGSPLWGLSPTSASTTPVTSSLGLNLTSAIAASPNNNISMDSGADGVQGFAKKASDEGVDD